MSSLNANNIGEVLLNSFINPYLNRAGGYTVHNTGLHNRIPVDMVNEEKNITIYAEVPGVEKGNIEVDFFNNKLTISAEKIKSYDTVSDGEISYGRFERQITLPICVTRKETVTVSHHNGILKVVINKLIEEENRFSMRVN